MTSCKMLDPKKSRARQDIYLLIEIAAQICSLHCCSWTGCIVVFHPPHSMSNTDSEISAHASHGAKRSLR